MTPFVRHRFCRVESEHGARELMSHWHEPRGGSASAVVVLLDGAGRDQVLGFRSYRMLAERCAAAGMLAVRFAWSGAADSAGPAPGDDRPAPERWLEDLDAVLSLAREAAPGVPVALVGLKLSAIVATDYAASRPGTVDQVILWEPAGSGRTWLRAQETLHKMSPEFLAREERPPLPEGSAEVPGALFEAGDAAAIRGLRLAPPPGVRVDVITRPSPVADRNLAATMAAAGSTHEIAGQAEAFDSPSLLATVSLESLDTITSLVERAGSPVGCRLPEPRPTAVVATQRVRGRDCEVRETIVDIDGMHGVLTHAVGPTTRALLTIPGSGEPLDGPTGLWSHLTRRAAARGVTSLRLDRRGAGEASDPADHGDPWPYRKSAVDDLSTGLAWLRTRTGLTPSVVGMCSGAWIAMQVALREKVDDVIAVNLVYWDVEALPGGNPIPDLPDPGLAVVAQPDAARGASRMEALSTRSRALAKQWLPGPAFRWAAARGLVQSPDALFHRVTERGTTVHQILSAADLQYVDGQRMRTALRRVGRSGGVVTVVRRRELDHALLSHAARLRAVDDILAVLNRTPARRGDAA